MSTALRLFGLSLFGLAVTASRLEAATLYVFKADGNIIALDSNHGATEFATGIFRPTLIGGMAFDSKGDLYVTTFNMIERIDKAGVRNTFAPEYYDPRAVAFDQADNLYVAKGEPQGIDKFDTNGVGTLFLDGDDPDSLAFDSAGHLYVDDSQASVILKVNPNGSATTFAHSNSSGLAIDSADNLYALNSLDGTIIRFDANGVQTIFASGLSLPSCLAFDSAGDLYVGEYGGNKIEKFNTTTGLGTTIAQVSSPINIAIGPDLQIPLLLHGDYNGNGTVDAADYTVWRDHVGQLYPLQNRNPGAMGPINGGDYNFWVSHYGETGSGAGATAAAPEPRTLTLVAVGCLILASTTLHRRFM